MTGDRRSERSNEAAARLRALLEASIDAIVVMDHRGRVVEYSGGAEGTFGYGREEVIGGDLADHLLPPEGRAEFRRRLAEYRSQGRSPLVGRRFELTAMRADGSVFPAEVAFTVPDLPGPPLFVAYVRDIGERKAAEEALRSAREELAAIVRNVGDALTVQAPDGRLLYANAQAAALTGFDSPEELVSALVEEVVSRFELVDEAGAPLGAEDLPGVAVLAGASFAERVIGYRPAGGGEVRWSRVRATPVLDGRGRVRFAVNLFHDITEEVRLQRSREVLGEVNRLLGSSLDVEETLESLAALTVPALGDWCAVDLLEEDGSLRPIALAHVEPQKLEVVRAFREGVVRDRRDDRMMARVLRTGRSELVSSVGDELLSEIAGRGPEWTEMLGELDLGSLVCVPLRFGARTLGSMVLVATRRSGRAYGPDDLALAEEIGRRAALALENARLYQLERNTAQALQRSLLPRALPLIPGMQIATGYRPAGEGNEVGGDFYDLFTVGKGRWGVAVGDVQGKGVEAGAAIGLVRHGLRMAALHGSAPAHVLPMVDRTLRAEGLDLLCTAVYGLLERHGAEGWSFRFALAGHPVPAILGRAGVVMSEVEPGPPLGAMEGLPAAEGRLHIGPSEVLLLYTDGIWTGAWEPLERLVEGCDVSCAEAVVAHLLEGVDGFEEGPMDDIAIVALRTLPAGQRPQPAG